MEQLQDSVLAQAIKLASPLNDNYHNGLRMPEHLELPDNILCFWHDFPFNELQHNRYCIVIPFDRIEYVINDTPLDIAPGTAIVQYPYASHSIRTRRNCYRRLHISFELQQLPGYLPRGNEIVVMTAEAWRIVRRILRLFRNGDALGCALEVFRLCRELKGSLSENAILTHDRLSDDVDNLTEFRSNRRENIKSIAEQMQMSESNLRLRFRKENGVSLGKYLQRHKLEIAMYRLKYTRQSISEIAKVCGYDSQFSFSRFFKRQQGISPLQWRNLNRSMDNEPAAKEYLPK